ncbi:hypothetical protein PENTCL1PPCAC_29233, partial [Pristionchus entomophagus]
TKRSRVVQSASQLRSSSIDMCTSRSFVLLFCLTIFAIGVTIGGVISSSKSCSSNNGHTVCTICQDGVCQECTNGICRDSQNTNRGTADVGHSQSSSLACANNVCTKCTNGHCETYNQ